MHASADNQADPSYRDVAGVVVSRDAIARRLDELAREITDRYGGREITLLAVMTGALVFLADLIRRLAMPLRVAVTSVSSYPGGATRTHGPKLVAPPSLDVAGRDVLIIDDILDSGGTLDELTRVIGAMGPTSVRTCVLLAKDRPDLSDRFKVDFVGFEVADEFVVGYGLDHDNLYRNLPEICVLKGHAQEDRP